MPHAAMPVNWAQVPKAAASRLAQSRWGAAGVLAVALMAMIIQMNGAFNHDVAFTIVGAQRLLTGGIFGVDVVDPNPPLAWWLTMIPIAVAKAVGWQPETAFIGFTTLSALGALGLTSAILKRLGLTEARRGSLLVCAAVMLLLSPSYHFGQREHLMLIGALPWIAAAAAALQGSHVARPLRIAAGLLAGIAFCLKPHFLVIPVLVELLVLALARRTRASFRAENLALAAVGVAYAAAILVAAPEYLQAVVPDAAAYYRVSDVPLSTLLSEFVVRLAPLAVAWFVLRRQALTIAPIALTLIVAACGAGLAAMLQGKGWAYHWVPGIGFGVIGCAALYFSPDRAARRRGVDACAALLLLFATFGAAAGDLRRDLGADGPRERTRELAIALVREGGRGASVYAFATSPRDVHPAVLATGAQWIDPACCLQWIAAAVRSDEMAAAATPRTKAIADRKLAVLLRRLERRRPALILIDNRPAKLAFERTKFDYLPFLLADARFRRLWAGYEERPGAAGYRIFARKRPALVSPAAGR